MVFVDIGVGVFEGKVQVGQEFVLVGGVGGEDQVGYEVFYGEWLILMKRFVFIVVYG